MRFRLLATTVLALFCGVAPAHEFEVGSLEIDHPWSRALPPNAPAGAAYFTIVNKGEENDRLVGVQTPKAGSAMLHTTVQIGEMMKMQHLDSIAIPAGGKVEFKPNGNHVMLMGLKEPLVDGERFPLTLEFEKAGKVEVEVVVGPAAEEQSPHHH
ncbi:copper chaperone PCu(A)C [Pseudomonas indica]|jgi:copper(I)-binding protein|uniref:Copper(I)-binding protein n=1 Tax=Pseudomonas indica TaxID=137658 RepID=A0A1G8ZVQ3_9PSED|nr:copper chaperone PCu(A)C [Pseudomonas indica]MBU3055829.1 copper chaperone PCu(A)C [Pseudomonas indica]PAU54598.1 hypothetical protein BZL42_20685 [Pseudomonas indica]SDK19057.1 hypothetical protein SAMN05216186_10519 [Pseudomonas indica]